MTEEEIRTEIRSFLAKHIRNANIEDGDDLFTSGLVNSLFAMELVSFVEKTFKIRVANKDLNLNNFKTISAITDLIQRNSVL
jgi:methoxymalonate biosynthesis acyl carrier protein